MSLSEILNILENSWKRDDILLKIKKGIDTEKIVNDFLLDNEAKVKELSTLLRQEDKALLKQVEQLSTCEATLLNKINNLNYLKNNDTDCVVNSQNITISNSIPSNRIILFMNNWSNKFVVIALLTISAIALSKQAWA